MLTVVTAGALTASVAAAQKNDDLGAKTGIKHVLLISIDGMHAVDYWNCVRGEGQIDGHTPYCPNLAELGTTGVNYTNASTSKPSDSFPGLTAIVSGGSPKTFGAWYDVAYDRVLAPPATTTGNGVASGTCVPNQPNGTRTEYEEGIDINQNLLNGGAPGAAPTDGTVASIDFTKLPRDPYNGCKAVAPWNFVRANTIFGVIHQHGGYAAWADKHPAYSSVSGPGDGSNLDDFYGPEINSDATNPVNTAAIAKVTTALGESCASLDPNPAVGQWVDSFFDIRCYDQLKVNSILNQIKGWNHLGTKKTQVPNIFGMNFQAVSVGQKLIEGGVKGGYTNAEGLPTDNLLKEIEFVDTSIGAMVTALKGNGLYESTLFVITAKHGQSPIDTNRFFPIPGHSGTNGLSPATLIATDLPGYIPDSESPLGSGIGSTEDDISLLWLAPGSDVGKTVDLLEAHGSEIGLGQILQNRDIQTMFDTPGLPPSGDPRTPDLIVVPNYGVIYTGSKKKQSEHGGFAHDDTNVMLLLSNPAFVPKTVTAEVQTAQVAPTVLKALGLNPMELQAAKAEGTQALPAVQFVP